MIFTLTVNINQTQIHLRVEKIKEDKSFEQFRIIGRDRTVTIQSNRPMLREKGLKSKPTDWKLVSGEFKNQGAFKAVMKALEFYMDQLDNPVPKDNK